MAKRDDDETVYLSNFWPEPSEPAALKVELTVKPTETAGEYTYFAHVTKRDREGRDGEFKALGGHVDAKTIHEARHAGMFELVELLGEMLATEIRRPR